jgi:hypothetical protein
MDRRRHVWFIVLGGLLAAGVLLLARQWLSPATEQGSAPASVAATEAVEPKPEEVTSTAAAAATTAAQPAPAASTGGTFRGRIIDAVTRQPIREFEVQLTRVRRSVDEYREENPIAQTFQSSTGRFAWKDVQASTWKASISARGYRRFDVDEFSIEVGKSTPEVVMPLLRGFTVRGRVVDVHSGAGIGAATVWFRDPSSPQRFESGGSTKSKQDGSFELDGVPGGDVTLSAGANEYAPRDVEVFVGNETPPVDISLSMGGVISGRVLTAAGAPVKGTIMMTGGEMPHGTQTNEEGEFSFSQLTAGTYTLTATTPAGSARERIELNAEEHRPDVMLMIAEGRTVRGTIRGLRPDQLRETMISSRSQTRQQSSSARPNDQGAYALNGLPPGRASLHVQSRGRRMQKWIDVPADRDLVLDIEFPPGSRLSGRVTQGGQAAAGKGIMMQPAGPMTFTLYHATTSADGQYEIEGVPAGDYRIRADEDVSRSVTIVSDTVVNIDIPSVQLGGRVFEQDGTVPIVGADIYLRGVDDATRQVRGYKKSDHFGEFKLTGVEPGEVEVTVYKPGYDMYREKIAYSSPITNKVIRLRRGGGVEIRVQRSAKGEPADGLLVFERGQGNQPHAQYWILLDRNGVGYLPSALTGSTLMIGSPGLQSITIREWDGSSLDLKF